MFSASFFAAVFCSAVSFAGNTQALLGAVLLHRFRKHEANSHSTVQHDTRTWPGVTILKPLHGDEPLLRQALESLFTQDYPSFQIVFGLHSADDSARPVIESLCAAYPHVAADIVIDPTEHGPNRKVGNLINMYGQARHHIIVISDSDIHCASTYLKQVVASFDAPNTGLVTTLYAGRPGNNSVVQQLGACQINHNFLPGVMMSRLLGRQDCLVATMALTRATLSAIGGLEALVNHVADDAQLGRLIRENGQNIVIAPTLTHTTVSETSLRDLILHELRWGRTVKNEEPVGYGLSSIQLPLFWASAAVLFQPRASWPWLLLLLSWGIRAVGSSTVNRVTKTALPASLPLLPLRDWLSAAIMVGSARGSRVAWRGRTVHIAKRKRSHTAQSTRYP